MKRVLILIPARYQSSRFPGKPLAPLKNKPLIQHVVEKASEVSIVNGEIEVAVVTDHSQIEKTCLGFGAKVIESMMTLLLVQIAYFWPGIEILSLRMWILSLTFKEMNHLFHQMI